MEVTIPYWFIWVFAMLIPVMGGWLIFLTKMAFQAKEDQRIGTANDVAIMKELSDLEHKMDETKKELNTKMDEGKKDFHDSLNRLGDRIDKLFGAELSFMKSLMTGNKPL